MPEITILPAQGCRRSRKILDYLEQHAIPFTRINLESDEGQALAERYSLRASPGILVDGQAINPFDLLIQPQCRVHEAAAAALFLPSSQGES